MDYLKSFTIGTSALVPFTHYAVLALADKKPSDNFIKAYSFLTPLFYGSMTMFATYLRKNHGLSLQESLLRTSVLAFFISLVFQYSVIKQKHAPFKNFSEKEWLRYLINNGTRYLVNFNVIVYLLEKYFSLYPVKIFVIGSSIFAYFITYLKVIWLDWMGKLNYKYETFLVHEAFTQGFDLLVSLYVYNKLLGFDLKTSLILWTIISSFIWLFLAFTMGTYKHKAKGWGYGFLRVLLTGVVKAVILYYLIINLNGEPVELEKLETPSEPHAWLDL